MTRTHAATTAPATAGAVLAYDRVSRFKERETGETISRAVRRQRKDNDAAAEARGLPAPVHFVDDGVSASRFATKSRDGWADLLGAIQPGVAFVIVWLLDRAIRQTRDLDDLLDACRHAGAKILQSGSGTVIDPNDPDSVTLAKIAGVLAEAEIAKMSIRQRRAHAELKANGGYPGGRRRFGYTPGMKETVPAEAAAIQDAMTRILNGESLSSISRLWNDAGLVSAEGNPFSATTVSHLVRRRDLAKIRAQNGVEVMGNWDAPAIVSAATSSAVIRHLSANKPLWGDGPHPGRTHDYSGLVVCGECGTPMYGKPSKLKSGPAFFCRNPARTAPHPQAPVRDVETGIRAAVIARLSRVDAAGAFVVEADKAAADARAAERTDLTANRAETVKNVRLRPGDKADALEAIDTRLAELDAEDTAEADAVARPQRVLDGLVGLPADETAAAFDALPLDRRRNVISVLGTPVLKGANLKKGVWNPRRLFLVWDEDGNLTDA